MTDTTTIVESESGSNVNTWVLYTLQYPRTEASDSLVSYQGHWSFLHQEGLVDCTHYSTDFNYQKSYSQ